MLHARHAAAHHRPGRILRLSVRATKMTALVEQREARLIDALGCGDRDEIEDRRYDLLDALRKRQGILNAISAYERGHQQSA